MSQEMRLLQFGHLTVGTYDDDHGDLSGLEYLELDECFATKTNALTVSNPALLIDTVPPRAVMNIADDISPLKLYRRILERVDPRQTNVFCHVLSKAQKKTLSGIQGQEHIEYNWQKPMAEGSIEKFCRVLNKRCQVPGIDLATNHCWRAWLVTKMNANKNLSSAASCAHSRHKTVKNQLPYDRRNVDSDINVQQALQVVPVPVIPSNKKAAKKGGKRGVSHPKKSDLKPAPVLRKPGSKSTVKIMTPSKAGVRRSPRNN